MAPARERTTPIGEQGFEPRVSRASGACAGAHTSVEAMSSRLRDIYATVLGNEAVPRGVRAMLVDHWVERNTGSRIEGGCEVSREGVSMRVVINDNELNVELLGDEDAPVLIAHHGGGGIGSLDEPKATFGPLANSYRVVVFDARGCGLSEGKPPFSHAQWAADVDALREWLGVERIIVAGGSYGGFIAMEYALAYPEHTRAMILRDTSADRSNLERAYENARSQTRIEINWENFDRYWQGRITDDEDLKERWAEIIPLYDIEYDAERSRKNVDAGIYRHEAHNWCFQHNLPNYDLRAQLPSVTCPTLVTVGRADWVTPVSSAQTIASLIPNAKLVVFEKSGHSPQVEEFDLFQQVMRDFLLTVQD